MAHESRRLSTLVTFLLLLEVDCTVQENLGKRTLHPLQKAADYIMSIKWTVGLDLRFSCWDRRDSPRGPVLV